MQGAGGEFGRRQGAWIKRNVGAHAAVARILGVAVALPIGGPDMDFHVAGDAAQFGTNPERGIQEIGAGAGIPFARVLHLQPLAAGGEERVRAQAAIGPDALEVPFAEGGKGNRRRFADAAGRRAVLLFGFLCTRKPVRRDAGGKIHGVVSGMGWRDCRK